MITLLLHISIYNIKGKPIVAWENLIILHNNKIFLLKTNNMGGNSCYTYHINIV